MEIELVLDCKNTLGESPVWDAAQRELIWVSIEDRALWHYAVGGDARVEQLPERPCCVALGPHGRRVLVGLESGFASYDSDTGELERLAAVESELSSTRLNDGRTDRQGRLICGGLDEAEPPAPISAVYSLEPTGAVRPIISGITCANSICFSLDGRTMYFTDMPTRQILAYQYDPETGTPHDPVLFADCAEGPGLPDGSIVDAEGFIWNARWNGSRVVRYAPDGRIDRVVEVPVPYVTCPAFGGPGLDTLFITTAAPVDAAPAPGAGGLYQIDAGVRGVPETRFGGGI